MPKGNPHPVIGGRPVEGHEKQCHARSKITRQRCGKWALTGSKYCQFHGGRRSSQFYFRKGKFRLPGFYSKYLGPTLKNRVQQLLAVPHAEQVSLYEELAIARSTACEALQLSQPLFDEKVAAKLTPETKALLIQTLNQAMINVKELVIAAARIEKDAEDKVSIKVINLVVMQIVMSINEVCGTENMALAEAINKAIDEKVRLPLNDKISPKVNITIG